MQAAAGDTHALTLSDSGEVHSFGSNFLDTGALCGKLGLGECSDVVTPTKIPELNDIVEVSCGYNHSACLDSFGNVYTFGANFGNLGLGDNKYRASPCKVPLERNIVSISCGTQHTICVDSEGSAWSFGINLYGQLGLGDTNPRYSPERIKALSNIEKLFAGGQHNFCFSRSNELYCFGANSFGQLGLGDCRIRMTPVLHEFPFSIQISCGFRHTLFLTSSGEVFSCGDNSRGELGLGDQKEREFPQKIQHIPDMISVLAGDSVSHCIDIEKNLWSFGTGNRGQMGFECDFLIIPTKSEKIRQVLQVVSGGKFTLVRTTTDVYAYGVNNNGQLGLGKGSKDSTPPSRWPNEAITMWADVSHYSSAKSARK